MIGRTASRLLRIVAGLFAALGLLAALAVWRLSAAPVSVDFLTPSVARAIASADREAVVRIDHAAVQIGEGAILEIVARGVHLAQRDGDAELTLPELDIGLSLRAALRGVAAPTRIVLKSPQLRLERAADGSFHLGLGASASAAGNWAGDLLRRLAATDDRRGWLGYLTQVSVRDAAFTVDDRALGVKWEAKRADVTLFRGARGITVKLSLVVATSGGVQTAIHGELRYATGEARLALQLGFSDLPPLFSNIAPALESLQLPSSGQISLELDPAALHVLDAKADVTLGGGAIVHPAFRGGRLAIASGQVRAAYDPAAGRIAIERLRLDLGGPQLDATGTVEGLGKDLLAGTLPPAVGVAIEARLSAIPTSRLPALWPERFASPPRLWIAGHLHHGTVGGEVRLRANIDLSAGAKTPLRFDRFDGKLEYRGLTVDYLESLPPVQVVEGTATFDRARLDLAPVTGVVNGVQMTGGTVRISKLDSDDQEIAIDVGLRGPLRNVLEVLDSKRLGYARALKIDPQRVSGNVTGRLAFAFPLSSDLEMADVDAGARATLNGAAIARVLFDQDFSAGELELRLDRKSFQLEGTGHFAGAPVTLSVVQSLDTKDPIQMRSTVQAKLDDAARARFDFLAFLSGRAKGPIDVDVAYTRSSAARAAAVVALDLKDAALGAEEINWRKPPGIGATATLDLELVDDHLRSIRRATFKGGGLDAQLAIALGDSGSAGLSRVDVQRLVVGDTDVAGIVNRRKEGGWRIELHGRSFDATSLLAARPRAPGAAGRDPPLVIDANLKQLILGPKREARSVTGQLYSDGVHLQRAALDAAMSGGGKASLRFGDAASDHEFRLTTDDLGALLRLAGTSDRIVGGRLTIAGHATDDGPRRSFRGKADGADYRVVGASVLQRLLSLASFSGIGALLSAEGIPFSHLQANFVFADGKLDIQDGRAYGSAIGINAKGVYDADAGTVDFEGIVVPAYALNSVLGNIPVVGKLLMGGEGEGLFGANFRVSGSAADAKVSVNPLSAIAPGALRKLFSH